MLDGGGAEGWPSQKPPGPRIRSWGIRGRALDRFGRASGGDQSRRDRWRAERREKQKAQSVVSLPWYAPLRTLCWIYFQRRGCMDVARAGARGGMGR